METYHSLLTLESGRWGIAFGDYDLDVVKDERDDNYDGQRVKLIHTKPDQASIDAAVTQLNGGAL